jgi:hypothetical protein
MVLQQPSPQTARQEQQQLPQPFANAQPPSHSDREKEDFGHGPLHFVFTDKSYRPTEMPEVDFGTFSVQDDPVLAIRKSMSAQGGAFQRHQTLERLQMESTTRQQAQSLTFDAQMNGGRPHTARSEESEEFDDVNSLSPAVRAPIKKFKRASSALSMPAHPDGKNLMLDSILEDNNENLAQGKGAEMRERQREVSTPSLSGGMKVMRWCAPARSSRAATSQHARKRKRVSSERDETIAAPNRYRDSEQDSSVHKAVRVEEPWSSTSVDDLVRRWTTVEV